MIRYWWIPLALALLFGCVTLEPKKVPLPSGGVRVVSFALERGVRLGNLNGPVEAKPGVMSLFADTFSAPLLKTVEALWLAFPDQAAQFGGTWTGPGTESEHPNWIAASYGPLSSSSLNWSRARGFYWPEGLRFLDGTVDRLPTVASDFPDQLLLAVEYTMFVEDVTAVDQFGSGDFRVGLLARFALFGTDGSLLSRDTVVGYSETDAPRVNGKINRERFADLALEAQADVVHRWGTRLQFVPN